MIFSSHFWSHSVCGRLVRPLIQIKSRGQVGLQLKARLRADLSHASSQEEDERVYILGAGVVANLYAHSLARKPSFPPITLLWHYAGLAQMWEISGKCIKILMSYHSDKQYGFDTEILAHDNDSVRGESLIKNLIVCTTNEDTTKAIARIKHRLNEQSTILFANEALCIIDEVCEQVFTHIKSRPHFLASIFSHRLKPLSPFCAIHKRSGVVAIGDLPHGQLSGIQKDDSDSISTVEPSRYLIQQILDTPSLAAKEVSAAEIIQQRMERLVWNAMIHPLSLIFDRRYRQLFGPIDQRSGAPFGGTKILSLMQLLLREVSHVLRALPELQKNGVLATEFSPEKLEQGVMHLARLHGNITKRSTRQDVEAGKPSRIDYLNGYIVKRGERLGIDCVHNRTLVKMVKENSVIKPHQIDYYFPPELKSQTH